MDVQTIGRADNWFFFFSFFFLFMLMQWMTNELHPQHFSNLLLVIEICLIFPKVFLFSSHAGERDWISAITTNKNVITLVLQGAQYSLSYRCWISLWNSAYDVLFTDDLFIWKQGFKSFSFHHSLAMTHRDDWHCTWWNLINKWWFK